MSESRNAHTYCSIQDCKSTVFNKGINTTFHQFPSSTEMRNKWIKILKDRCLSIDWTRSRICSKHFENQYFDSRRQLKHNAIPTMFPAQNYNQKSRTSKIVETPVPQTKLDRLLNNATQSELQNDIKNIIHKLKVPAHLSSFVNEDLKCQPHSTTETQLWLLVKKQDHLITRLNQSLLQNKKHVEVLQKNLQESRAEKKEMEVALENFKYISKCLQEKHATLEEQIEILAAIESRI